MGEKFTSQRATQIAAGGFPANARNYCSSKLNLARLKAKK